jgi:hypothetical protein
MMNMNDLFYDILNTNGVKGILLFSFSGDIIFKEFISAVDEKPENLNWRSFIESLEGMRETDLVFEKGRIYIRRSEVGYLVVLMALFVPTAMVRLNCDIVLPMLRQQKPVKKFGRLLKIGKQK